MQRDEHQDAPDGSWGDGAVQQVPAALASLQASHRMEVLRKNGRVGYAWWPDARASPSMQRVAMRLDAPTGAIGMTPPPCRVHARRVPGGDDFRFLVTPGRLQQVAQWLQEHGFPEVELPPGLAPRTFELRLADAGPGVVQRLLKGDAHRMEFAPEGVASFFLHGEATRVEALLDQIRLQVPAARVRAAFDQTEALPLTRRQREALALAVAWGYYEVPRCTKLRDLAEAMDLSLGATSELLRRGERLLLHAFFDRETAIGESWTFPA